MNIRKLKHTELAYGNMVGYEERGKVKPYEVLYANHKDVHLMCSRIPLYLAMPIPLKPKHLLDNGFIAVCENIYVYYEDSNQSAITVRYGKDKNNDHYLFTLSIIAESKSLVMQMSYVHEFQNAIRLLGFNKLLNNLKIKEV